MSELKAKILCVDSSDQELTNSWLNRTGVALTVNENSEQVFEIQFVIVPEVLLHYHHFQGYLSISRISSDGITFYLNDMPLMNWRVNGKPIASSENADGIVFCPMTNVVCINDFGPIHVHRLGLQKSD